MPIPLPALMRRAALAGLCLAVPLYGCEDTDQSNGPAGDTDNPPSDQVDCTPNTTDGTTACSNEQCVGGEYCHSDFSCRVGCASTLNCNTGQWCDKRQAQTDPDGTTVGVCRSTTEPVCTGDDSSAGSGDSEDSSSDSTTGPADPSCSDVEGNYRVSLDNGAPELCEAFVQTGDMCSVAQSECTLTWGCGGQLAQILTPGPIDSDDVYSVSGSLMGIGYECDFEFTPGFDGFFSWSCSANMSGQAIVCQGFGSKQ